MATNNPRCATCKFFEAGDQTCRFNAPVFFWNFAAHEPRWNFPVVDPHKTWCGQHKLRIAVAV